MKGTNIINLTTETTQKMTQMISNDGDMMNKVDGDVNEHGDDIQDDDDSDKNNNFLELEGKRTEHKIRVENYWI
jgi:hypothetical protein